MEKGDFELYDFIKTRGDCVITIDLFIQLTEGLKLLHDKNITHNDIKPANIIVVKNNDNVQLKYIDFGFMIYNNRPCFDKQDQDISGTDGFKSPEVERLAEYTKFNDIWALGCIFYFMLSKDSPFKKTKDVINEPPNYKKLSVKSVRKVTRFDGSKLKLSDNEIQILINIINSIFEKDIWSYKERPDTYEILRLLGNKSRSVKNNKTSRMSNNSRMSKNSRSSNKKDKSVSFIHF